MHGQLASGVTVSKGAKNRNQLNQVPHLTQERSTCLLEPSSTPIIHACEKWRLWRDRADNNKLPQAGNHLNPMTYFV